jgi:phage-related protein
MPTFSYTPAIGASGACKPTVESAKFGDGYEQRTALGINTQARQWNLKFTTHVNEVLAFLEARGGTASFDWTDPLGRAGKFICREWTINHSGATVFDVTGKFEQVFE